MPSLPTDTQILTSLLDFVDQTHACAQGFPIVERFRLARRLRRTALSVYQQVKRYVQEKNSENAGLYLAIAKDKLEEWDALLGLARERGYIALEQEEILRKVSMQVRDLLENQCASAREKHTHGN